MSVRLKSSLENVQLSDWTNPNPSRLVDTLVRFHRPVHPAVHILCLSEHCVDLLSSYTWRLSCHLPPPLDDLGTSNPLVLFLIISLTFTPIIQVLLLQRGTPRTIFFKSQPHTGHLHLVFSGRTRVCCLWSLLPLFVLDDIWSKEHFRVLSIPYVIAFFLTPLLALKALW